MTELGREILEKSKKIKMQLEDIQKISESTKAPLSHNLSIGIIPTVSPFILPYLLPKLSSDFPNCCLSLAYLKDSSNAACATPTALAAV